MGANRGGPNGTDGQTGEPTDADGEATVMLGLLNGAMSIVPSNSTASACNALRAVLAAQMTGACSQGIMMVRPFLTSSMPQPLFSWAMVNSESSPAPQLSFR